MISIWINTMRTERQRQTSWLSHGSRSAVWLLLVLPFQCSRRVRELQSLLAGLRGSHKASGWANSDKDLDSSACWSVLCSSAKSTRVQYIIIPGGWFKFILLFSNFASSFVLSSFVSCRDLLTFHFPEKWPKRLGWVSVPVALFLIFAKENSKVTSKKYNVFCFLDI